MGPLLSMAYFLFEAVHMSRTSGGTLPEEQFMPLAIQVSARN